jgi:predicted LPLAT superfamily acyltransferase
MLDRVYLLGRDAQGLTLHAEHPEALAEVVDAGRGCLLLGSHLGSFEASRAIKRERPKVALRLVMDRQHSPAATAFLEALNPQLAAQVLDIGGQPGAGLALLGALQDDALVALLADRVRGREKTVTASFFGRPAAFPAAPHELAMVTQAPVVMFWGLHEGPGCYRIVFERLLAPPKVGRKEREQVIGESVQRFADRLEHHARQAPYNWFNFYDFWADTS